MKKKYPAYTVFIGLAVLFFILTGVRFYDSFIQNEGPAKILGPWISPFLLGIAMLFYAWYMKKKAEKGKTNS